VSEDPLGALERELVAAARRRASGVADRRDAEAWSGALAAAFAGVAVILMLAAVLMLAGF
jgi:hypothetical protein